ncbi:putative anthocyanidin reductase [Prosopis cineraria]|uniref:putative anthocyanidin reductase n=1 Tax=Prosopis cineraria TaxID=364024 RepID=UPI00240F24F1|nr:putative anthocyanidin reductase [Prosopis cineraria]
MEKEELKVCVTGGSGYIAASLIKKLLLQGYTVHATLRNLKDESKVGFLRRLPHAEARLVLFEADVYEPLAFQAPIHGCHFVFHVATAFQHHQPSQYKSLTEATVEAAKEIAKCCIKAKTVRRLIYTSSVLAASPLGDDGATSLKDFIDESCWTPLHHLPNFPYINDYLKNYVESKTESEREILRYNERKEDGGLLEVVSLACGLVGGDSVLNASVSGSAMVIISQLKDSEMEFHSMRFIEELLGKIPIVHVQDVCDAHIFCLQKPSFTGRFLVASSYVSSADIGNYYLQTYPELHVKHKYLEGPRRDIKWGSTKLADEGFACKYDTKAILDDCVRCARRVGDL